MKNNDKNIKRFINNTNKKLEKEIDPSFKSISIKKVLLIFKKIEQLKALENVSGILNTLTNEQMNIFEETIKRNSFF